jgi:hypothetical protein
MITGVWGFSCGARSLFPCIAFRVAALEMQVIALRIVLRFTKHTTEDH